MDSKTLDELVNTLGLIALMKSTLPYRLLGWVSALGLNVQERQAGKWSRLQAGGKFRNYFDAWRQEEGDWEVRKFDERTWERRFSGLEEPTYEIAAFLNDCVVAYGGSYGGLDSGPQGAILKNVIEHYKSTGEWLGLPAVPQEAMSRRFREDEERKLTEEISQYEAQTRENPQDSAAWSVLAMDYERVGRYKDMENALKRQVELNGGWSIWIIHKYLGRVYIAALSNSTRGRGVPIFGHAPSEVTPDSLAYTVEEVRSLAENHLRKAYEPVRGAEFDGQDQEVEEIALAIKAVSSNAFDEYDRFMAERK